MTTNKKFDAALSKWFEESAPTQLPERVLIGTFERTRRSGQVRGWHWLVGRLRLSEFALMAGSAAAILVVAGLAAGLLVNRPGIGGDAISTPPATPIETASPTTPPTAAPTAQPTPTPDPRQPFIGVWVSTADGDGGTQKLTVAAGPADGALTVVVLDTIASVCSGTSSTMTGQGAIDGNNLVIAEPNYTCDDGSEPHLLNGDPTPLNEILRNLTYVLNSELDILTVGDDVWVREGSVPSSPKPSPQHNPFVGKWQAMDPPPESSHLTMKVVALINGTYRVVIKDDAAAVCDGVPSTMTGIAEGREPGTIVIAQPNFRCDDGSEPQALSGPPLDEQLKDYTLIYDSERDQLQEPSGFVWSRAATNP